MRRKFSSIVLSLMVAVLVVNLMPARSARAFSPETHTWVAQQVLDDAQDGKLTFTAREFGPDGEVTSTKEIEYALDAALAEALRNHPAHYIMGHVGPDAFPDPVVGQTTVHPGTAVPGQAGGWYTDDFLQHLMSKADSPEELAFAYGYIGHAAGDMFAHTYVNQYTGDIFELTDGEQEVELRHFVLEKFFGQFTPNPPRDPSQFDVPAEFVADTLIMDADAAAENLRAKAGTHLTAMYTSRTTIAEAANLVAILRDETNNAFGLLLPALDPIIENIDELKIAVDIAQEAANAAEKVVDVEYKIWQEKGRLLDKVIADLEKINTTIKAHDKIIDARTKSINATVDTISALNGKISTAKAKIDDLKYDLARTPATITEQVCRQVEKWLPWPLDKLVKETVCEPVEKVNQVYYDLLDSIKKYEKQLSDLQSDLSAEAAKKTKLLNERAAEEEKKAAAVATRKTLEALRTARAAEEKAAKAVYDAKKKLFNEAGKGLDAAKVALKRASDAATLKEDLSKAINVFGHAHDYLANWRDDYDRAAAAYIEVGGQAAVKMVRREGGTLDLYTDWWACWSPVLTGVPSQVAIPGCELVKQLDVVIPGICQQLDILERALGVSGELAKVFEKVTKIDLPVDKVEGACAYLKETALGILKNEGFKLLGHIIGPDLARMLQLMENKEPITEAELNKVFAEDSTSKHLLLIGDMAERVKADMQVRSDGTFDPEKFAPVHNAVVLTKLSLLSPRQLNRLFRDLAGPDAVTVYGPSPYPTSVQGRYSLLFDAVRSIDGNHAWQPLSLPYPRQGGILAGDMLNGQHWPDERRYGYDAPNGLRFWIDETARAAVFQGIFIGPLAPGLAGHPYYTVETYPFVECAVNPFASTDNAAFPSTFTVSGRMIGGDYDCDQNKPADTNPAAIVVNFTQIGPNSQEGRVTDALVFQVEAQVGADAQVAAGAQDGAGIASVQMRVVGPDGTLKHQHTANAPAYCAFGENQCVVWDFAAQGFKWPDGQAVQNGLHSLVATVYTTDNRIKTVTHPLRIENALAEQEPSSEDPLDPSGGDPQNPGNNDPQNPGSGIAGKLYLPMLQTSAGVVSSASQQDEPAQQNQPVQNRVFIPSIER